MIECSCGRGDCVTRLYVQDDSITLQYSPKITSAPFGEVTFYADDDALKKLIKDALGVLRARADQRLRVELGIEEMT